MIREALMQAILDNHADDTSRLVLADWLDEQGESERAEFIRLQCELAGNPHCKIDPNGSPTFCNDGIGRPFPCGPCKLRRRERELLRPNGGIGGVESMWPRPEWSGGIVEFFRMKGNGGYQYHRGFVRQIVCRWESCRDHLDAIRQLQPVRSVVLTTPCHRYSMGVSMNQIVMLNGPKWTTGVQTISAVASTEQIMSLLVGEWGGIEFELPHFVPFEAELDRLKRGDLTPDEWEVIGERVVKWDKEQTRHLMERLGSVDKSAVES